MTRIAQSHEQVRQNRTEFRDSIVKSIMTPYTLLCVALIVFGVAVTLLDAKGVPILLICLVLVAGVRLLFTLRQAQRRTNELLEQMMERRGS
ncbi:hypothetical protein [Deinococcus xianganensis]|uniref:Uncharacterized protein n=1 Tax=Deinococcus xianganensis TaxID=1507289 RepID=A0A6I4YLK6_9DEIO|nr:hypothetical protein [Deinococcus xianganensis]MXV20861.1 hypothetical protein [Deinococcus xianganensis]